MNYIDDIEGLEYIIRKYVQFIEEHSIAQNKLDRIEKLKEKINTANKEIADEVINVSNVNKSIIDEISKIRKSIEKQNQILSDSINWEPASNAFDSTLIPEISHTSTLFNDPNKEARKIKQELEKRLAELRLIVPDDNKIRKIEEEKRQNEIELEALMTSNSMRDLLNKATAEKKIVLESKYSFSNFLAIIQPQLLAEKTAIETKINTENALVNDSIKFIDKELEGLMKDDLVKINLDINETKKYIEKTSLLIQGLQGDVNNSTLDINVDNQVKTIEETFKSKLDELEKEKERIINRINELKKSKESLMQDNNIADKDKIEKLQSMYDLSKTLFSRYQVDFDEVDYYKDELNDQQKLDDLANSFLLKHQKNKIEIAEPEVKFEKVNIEKTEIKEGTVKYEDIISNSTNKLVNYLFDNINETKEETPKILQEEESKILEINDKKLKLKNSDKVLEGNLISTDYLASKIDKAIDEYINDSISNTYVVKAVNKFLDKHDIRIKLANMAIKRMNKIVFVKDENRNTKIVSKKGLSSKTIFNVPKDKDIGEVGNSYVREEDALNYFDIDYRKNKVKEKLSELKDMANKLKEYSQDKLNEYDNYLEEAKGKEMH